MKSQVTTFGRSSLLSIVKTKTSMFNFTSSTEAIFIYHCCCCIANIQFHFNFRSLYLYCTHGCSPCHAVNNPELVKRLSYALVVQLLKVNFQFHYYNFSSLFNLSTSLPQWCSSCQAVSKNSESTARLVEEASIRYTLSVRNVTLFYILCLYRHSFVYISAGVHH